MGGEELGGPWVLVSRQSEKFDRQRRASLEAIAEQQKVVKAEEEEAKKYRSPFIPDIFYKPIHNPERLLENCAIKSAYGGVAGTAFGFLFGVFISSTAYDAQFVDGQGTTKQKVIDSFKQTWRSSVSTAKNFGMFSVVFSGVECVIEKHRAKSDRYNSLSAGCVTGAVFGAKAGPTAALWGCGTVAAFSAAIDFLFMSH